MSVAKLGASGDLSSMKSEEGNDSLDIFIRQAFGKASLTPSLRSSGSPVQFVQLLHGLDGPGLKTQQVLGWPLSQPKMQKCEKCSREFWSPINYRRHVRVHRRSVNENEKNRDLLAAFWDTLSLEQAKELMSFSGVMLKDIPGLKIIEALTSSLHPPVVWSFPPVCMDAGATLVDIIQAKPSRLPIKSHDLFSVLDDASEGTFLCAGTAESVQKYIFVGNTAKNSLELNNLVASIGFLFEQQLVKAWFADKDAEALRCQKLLVEEEEAAQRRQAAILEKKKRKKLRKEQKMKEIYGDEQVLDVVDSVDSPTLVEAFDLSSPDINSISPDAPQNIDSTLESLPFESDDIESQLDLSSRHILENSETIGPHVVSRNGPTQLTCNNWQVQKSHVATRPRFNVGQNEQTSKPNLIHKHATPITQIQQNRSRDWTKKYKDDSDKNGFKPPAFKEETTPQIEEPAFKEETTPQIEEPAFKEETTPQIEEPAFKEEITPQIEEPAFKEETTPQIEEPAFKEEKTPQIEEPAFKEETTPHIEEPAFKEETPPQIEEPAFKEETTPQIEKPAFKEETQIVEDTCDDVIIGSIPITLKSRREEVIIGSIPIKLKSIVSSLAEKNASENLAKSTVGRVNGHDRAIPGENSQSTNSDCDNQGKPPVSSNAKVLEGSLPFRSASAKELLARRLKEANSAEHVKLVISSPPELPPGRCVQNHKTASQVSDIPNRIVLGNAENSQVDVGVQAK